MATLQQDVARLQADNTAFATAIAAISTEITALKNQGVDTTGLEAALTTLETNLSAAQALEPPPAVASNKKV